MDIKKTKKQLTLAAALRVRAESERPFKDVGMWEKQIPTFFWLSNQKNKGAIYWDEETWERSTCLRKVRGREVNQQTGFECHKFETK